MKSKRTYTSSAVTVIAGCGGLATPIPNIQTAAKKCNGIFDAVKTLCGS